MTTAGSEPRRLPMHSPSVLAGLRAEARGTWTRLRDWRQAHPQRRIVASLGNIVPEELCAALGMAYIPLLATGGGSSSGLDVPLCPIQGSMAPATSLPLDFLVVDSRCQQARDLATLLAARRGLPVHVIRGHSLVADCVREILRLSISLERVAGCELHYRRLASAVTLLDRKRRLLRELIRARLAGRLSLSDLWSLVELQSAMPVPEHVGVLAQVLESLEAASVAPPGRPRVCLLSQCVAPSLDLLAGIERSGLDVADGWMPRTRPAAARAANPLRALALYYCDSASPLLTGLATASQQSSMQRWLQARGSSGVLILQPDACELAAGRSTRVARQLDGLGVANRILRLTGPELAAPQLETLRDFAAELAAVRGPVSSPAAAAGRRESIVDPRGLQQK